MSGSLSDSNHPAGLFTTATYNAPGMITSATLGNGIGETYQYNDRLWTTSIRPARSIVLRSGMPPNGNVTSANDIVNGNWTYTYDAFNRLSTANGGTNNNYIYGYDQYGNRWSQTGPYSMSLSFSGGNNRIDGYGYSNNGNLLVDNQGCSYTYDAENRITGVSGGTCTSTTFGYDGLGRRISKMTSAGTKYYVYDRQDRPFVETTSATTWTRMELYAGSRHVGTYSGGPTGATYFSYDDWLGSERVRTHMNGSTSETCTSLPFGDGQTCTGAEISPIHFTGKQRDTETGNDYFGASYYSSSLARFVTPDWSKNPQGVPYADFANPQSLNLYGYVRNNPLSTIDPDGHCGGGPGDAPCSANLSEAQVTNIVYNETRSLSGSDVVLSDARQTMAHAIINGDNSQGSARPVTAPDTLGKSSDKNTQTYKDATEDVHTACTEAASGIDQVNGAVNFNLRPNASQAPYQKDQKDIQTQAGPLNNSFPSSALPKGKPVYVNTYKKSDGATPKIPAAQAKPQQQQTLPMNPST